MVEKFSYEINVIEFNSILFFY